MKSLFAAIALALALPLASPAVHAQTKTVGNIEISAPWARATPRGSKVGSGYVTIKNVGTTPDRLIGGSLAVAGKVEVHEMKTEGGVMKMRALDTGLEIAPGETVALNPGGTHLMFMDLKQPIVQGDKAKGTLVFEKAGTIEVEYDVKQIGAPAEGHHHH